MKNEVRFYRSPAGNEPVRDWLRKLPKEERREMGIALMRVQMQYPDIGMPLVEPVGKKISAVRLNVRDHWLRVLFTVRKTTIILLHGITKKTNKLDKADIDLAIERMKEK
jgi:phage-related protein